MMHEDQRLHLLYESVFAVGSNFLQQGKFEEALIIFDGLIALEPNEEKAAVAYGEALLMANRAENALNHFFSLSKQFEMNGRTLILTAKACILLDKPDEAKKLLAMVFGKEINADRSDHQIASAMLALLRPSENSPKC